MMNQTTSRKMCATFHSPVPLSSTASHTRIRQCITNHHQPNSNIVRLIRVRESCGCARNSQTLLSDRCVHALVSSASHSIILVRKHAGNGVVVRDGEVIDLVWDTRAGHVVFVHHAGGKKLVEDALRGRGIAIEEKIVEEWSNGVVGYGRIRECRRLVLRAAVADGDEAIS